MQGSRVPISALVVGFNEAHLLEECLRSLQFCEEIIFCDLGSGDASVTIAKSYSTKVITMPWSPNVEPVHAELVKQASFDWVMLVDPDERISAGLKDLIVSLISTDHSEKTIGSYSFPWHYYFGQRKLKGNPWGYHNRKNLLFHKERFKLTETIHNGRIIKDGFLEKKLGDENQEYGIHLWVSGWKDFFQKHKRYLKLEGEMRYRQGARPRRITVWATFFREFWLSWVTKKGYLDRGLGLALSAAYAWYQARAMRECWKWGKMFKWGSV